ncbi:uncharacterized protein [Hetaerina americana]|uniref:uncharacterized protein n=1 Tax=Hetaerina americana TaxID=62018 RepID=UPI003A7F4B77
MVETGSLPRSGTTREISRIPSESSLASVKILRTCQLQNAVTAANLKDPSFNYDQLWKSSFYIKIAQWAIAIICAGLYTRGNELNKHSMTARALPYVVFFAYILINSVVIVSYAMKEKMPEMLVRMFGFLGGVLFSVTGVLSLYIWSIYKDVPPGNLSDFVDNPERAKACLLAEGILDIVAASLYYVDTFASYYKSLNGIFI